MPIGVVVRDAPSNFEAVANGDNGAPLGRELEIADLLRFIKQRRVRNVVWITGDVHYCAAHHYDPARARFTEFDPFWEFVAGPLHAGTFGPNELDATFGPEVRFVGIPPGMKPNRPPSRRVPVLRHAARRSADARADGVAARSRGQGDLPQRARGGTVNIQLVLLIVYSVGSSRFGLWTSRLVRGSSDFFVAGRSLRPGLLFSTMLAANIGAGSTVGVAGLAYRDGISAWWWDGSAGIGSLCLRVAGRARACGGWRRDHNFYTDRRLSRVSLRRRPSGSSSRVIICIGSLAMLAGQLIAGAAILNVVAGAPRWARGAHRRRRHDDLLRVPAG